MAADDGESTYQVFEKLQGVTESRNLRRHLKCLDAFVNAEYVDKINYIIATVPKETFSPKERSRS